MVCPQSICRALGLTAPGAALGRNATGYLQSDLPVYDDAFITRGNHGLKFGFEFLATQNDIIAVNGINGNATFTSALKTP